MGKLGDTIEDMARRDERLRNTRGNLLMMLEARYGTIPEALLEQINACQELSRLQTWIRQVARTHPQEELRLE